MGIVLRSHIVHFWRASLKSQSVSMHYREDYDIVLFMVE